MGQSAEDPDMASKMTRHEWVISGEKGILSMDGAGFHIPSNFAIENLYYILASNDYLCDVTYAVDRTREVHCYQIMYLVSGTMTVRYEGKEYPVPEGSLILLDLRKPHYYRADSKIRMQWYLMNGVSLPAYYEYLTRAHSPVFSMDRKLIFLMNSLKKEMMEQEPNDHVVSMLITEILCSLSINSGSEQSEPISRALTYMDAHYSEPVSLDEIAAHASLSKYYFSRQFQNEVGLTPWEYLTRARMRHAMQMLSDGGQSIESIAYACGYAGSSHFCRAFKKETGFSPAFFRKFLSNVPMGLDAGGPDAGRESEKE